MSIAPSVAPEPPVSPPRAEQGGRVSLLRYSPALVIVAIAVADSLRYSDPDLWGHIRFGQDVLASGHLARSDVLSYTAPGHPWLNHEWLTEVMMAAVYNLLGVVGLKLGRLVLTASMILMLAMAEGETGAPTLVQFGVLILSSASLALQIQYRPQILTFAMLSATMLLLARDVYRRAGQLWIMIPMLALWANLHGGFILGMVSIGIYAAVSAAQDVVAGRGIGRAIRLGLIAGVATLATLITPYGIGTWRAVWHALRNPYTRTAIIDWTPYATTVAQQWQVSHLGIVQFAIAGLLASAFIVSFIMAPDVEDLPMVAIGFATVVAAELAVRNMPVALIAIATPLTRHLGLVVRKRGAAGGASAHGLVRSPISNQAVICAAAIVVLISTGLFTAKLGASDPYPASAVRFMKAHGLKGNIFASFGWGEYLIWHMAPDSKVFIDGRYDTVYPDQVIRDLLRFTFAMPGSDAILDAYPHDFVLIGSKSKDNKIMATRKDWVLIYRDKDSRLYARAGSLASAIPGVPVDGVAEPSRFPW